MEGMALEKRSLRLPASGRTITYELERKSVKHMNLRMRRDGSLHLSVPARTTVAALEAYLIRCEDWILEAERKVQARAEAHPDSQVLAAGDKLPYLGGEVRVIWQASDGRTGSFAFDEAAKLLTVSVPDPSAPSWRIPAVEAFEKQQTALLIAPLIRQYLPLVQKRGAGAVRTVRYKRMVSRFGSCTAGTGTLCFNTRLCEYPAAFIEYVVVHELCHLLVQNHSPAFRREVAAILPDWKARRDLRRAEADADEEDEENGGS